MSKKLKNIALPIAVVTAGIVTTTALTYATTKSSDTTKVVTTSNSTSTGSSDLKLMDETVYVLAETNGNVRKIITSDWNKTAQNEDQYSKQEDNSKTVPISMKVTYKYDGKDISAEELAGKSGKVTIRYEFTNNERSGGYYMPYVILTGMILENDHFSNVSATNGRILNDGSRYIVAGIALPGMQENLGLNQSTLSLPSYLEVNADVNDFRLNMTVSIATSKIFGELDLDNVVSVADLESQLGKLSDAMSQLVGGSSELAKGVETLYSKVKSLPTGINALADGSEKLKNGAAALDDGISTLQNGLENLYTGINAQLVSQNENLQNGARAIFQNSLTATNNTVIDEDGHLFSDLVAGYCGASHGITALSYDNYNKKDTATSTLTCIEQIVAQTGGTESSPFSGAKAQLDQLNAFYTGIVAYTNGVAATNENVIKNQILTGITATDGLKAGSSALAKGASDLNDGVSTLKASSSALLDGVGQLRDGSGKLADGIQQFSNDGVQKLVNIYSGDIKGLINRIKTLSNLSKAGKPTKYIYRTDEINF